MVLGILLITALGFLGRSILTAVHKRNSASAPSSPALMVQQEAETLRKYDPLLQNNPFGISAGSLKNLPSGTEQAAAPADIRLTGTISGLVKDGYAVFTSGDGKQSIFRTGETIPGVGELRSVEKYGVFIKRNGKLTRIPMVEINASGAQEIAPGAGGASRPAQLLGKGDLIITQKALQMAVDNPTQLMMDAKLVPNIVKDRQEGFILREIRKEGLYDNLGLQNGDVFLQINGSNISSSENALQAFTALRGMDRVKLDVIRNNNRVTMNYQIR